MNICLTPPSPYLFHQIYDSLQSNIYVMKMISRLCLYWLPQGGSKFHLLVWDDEESEMCWEGEDAFQLEGTSTDTYSCNTRKDKDKRICWHTFGVLFGCSPCGIGLYSLEIQILCFWMTYLSEIFWKPSYDVG